MLKLDNIQQVLSCENIANNCDFCQIEPTYYRLHARYDNGNCVRMMYINACQDCSKKAPACQDCSKKALDIDEQRFNGAPAIVKSPYNDWQWRVLLRLQQSPEPDPTAFWFYRDLVEDNFVRRL